MECTVNRLLTSKTSTIGTFEINGQLKYYTMEPAKPIPAGRYEAISYYSPDHGYDVPMLVKVPGHSYIEIHIGNKPADTKNCTLLGYGTMMADWISNSKLAVADFYKIFFACMADKERVFVTYKDY